MSVDSCSSELPPMLFSPCSINDKLCGLASLVQWQVQGQIILYRHRSRCNEGVVGHSAATLVFQLDVSLLGMKDTGLDVRPAHACMSGVIHTRGSSQSPEQAAGGQGDADPASDVGWHRPELVAQVVRRDTVWPPAW